jgi:hypothetical protein
LNKRERKKRQGVGLRVLPVLTIKSTVFSVKKINHVVRRKSKVSKKLSAKNLVLQTRRYEILHTGRNKIFSKRKELTEKNSI